MGMKLTVQHVDGLRFLVTAGKHAVVVDAPSEEGGTDTAMNSPQLFAAAVAACALSFVANSWKDLRSSAASMLSGFVPITRTPFFSSPRARFNGVCPPNWTIAPQQFSFR